MRIIVARGPVVDALRRYDPGLRVRWSWEKGMWAVDAPLRRMDTEWMLPPVFYETTPSGVVEHLLPELSDRYIDYHEHRYTICWSKSLDWRLYYAIAARDSYRKCGGAAGEFVRNYKERAAARERKRASLSGERSEQAYDYMRYLNRKMPWADQVGGGISSNGMGV